MGGSLCMALALLLLCVEAHESHTRHVHGQHSSLWVQHQRVPPTQRVAFTLTLQTQTPHEELAALVDAVSDAASPQYGQFLTTEQLQQHYAPSTDAKDAVRSFLEQHGDAVQAETCATGDIVTLRTDAATAETLFHTRLFEYKHRDDSALSVVRPHSDGFVVPPSLAPHVVFIDGLESFPTPQQAQLMAQNGDPFAVKTLHDAVATSDLLATPGLIRAQYDVPNDIRHWNATHPRNQLVIAAFLNEYYMEDDLTTFLERYESRPVANFQFPKHTGDCIAGARGAKVLAATGEASLDVQVAVSLSRSANIQVLCFQSLRDPSRAFADDNQEPFLAFMKAVNAMDPPPSVVSISYTDEECAVPSGYRDAVNREFMKAALKGVSIVISAGDAGVQGSHLTDFCGIQPCSQFVAMFPASSPYVTAVGATSIDGASFQNGKYAERVTTAKNGDLITSGGGFSAVYPQPAYQTDVVRGYLAFADAHNLTSLFNAKGRAYPDITALGHSFPVYQNGKMWRTDGTSVSAPIVASLVALLNKHRLDQGLPVLGFLNPLLYKLQAVCPHVFQDVTNGDIACGGYGSVCCAVGHEAREGWDAASGVGTIKFATLARDLESCISKIKGLAPRDEIVLAQQQHLSLLQLPTDRTVMEIQRIGAVAALLAAVALFGALVSMRGRVFPGSRFFDAARNDPARERLLAGLE